MLKSKRNKLRALSKEMEVLELRLSAADSMGKVLCQKRAETIKLSLWWPAGGSTARIGVPTDVAVPEMKHLLEIVKQATKVQLTAIHAEMACLLKG